MKIMNWCKKLAITLVAAGLLHPSAIVAADLGVNLVVNGDFENVDLAMVGEYNAPLILNWTGPNLYAYSHDGSSSSAGVVPDYADGADPPGAGHWYFTNNNTGGAAFTDIHDPGLYYQDISLSSGATAVAIANGSATYDLSAYMSSYFNDEDYGNVLVEFRDVLDASIGSASISDIGDAGPDNVWSLTSTSGAIPFGASSVRISLYGTRGSVGGAGADGYIDNVSFSVSGVPEPSSILLAGIGIASASLMGRKRILDN